MASMLLMMKVELFLLQEDRRLYQRETVYREIAALLARRAGLGGCAEHMTCICMHAYTAQIEGDMDRADWAAQSMRR